MCLLAFVVSHPKSRKNGCRLSESDSLGDSLGIAPWRVGTEVTKQLGLGRGPNPQGVREG